MKVTAKQLAQLYNIDRKTVTNWLNEAPACPSALEDGRRMFDTVAVAHWREERAVRQDATRREREHPTDAKAARAAEQQRRERMETRMVEIDLAEREARIITVAAHEAVVGDLADRLRAVCINLPSLYGLAIEQLGVPPEAAEAVLEEIANGLVTALRGAADELEAFGDDAGDEDDADADERGDGDRRR